MKGLFSAKNNLYNLGNAQLLDLSRCRTKTYGFNAALFKDALLWNKLPNDFKEAKSLMRFRNKIREWSGRYCTCALMCS